MKKRNIDVHKLLQIILLSGFVISWSAPLIIIKGTMTPDATCIQCI